jgi:hypothetical protein
MRAPPQLIGLILLLAIGLAVYAYFTTPLPFGLSSVIRTPGSANVAAPNGQPSGPAASSRTAAGQPLVLGAASVVVQTVERNQDLAATSRGPAGSFTLVQIQIQNAGNEPLMPQASDFRLVDDRGRTYALDPEATRSAAGAAKRRDLFDATVPPGGAITTLLAFETPADANGLTLRVNLGYGELELPR